MKVNGGRALVTGGVQGIGKAVCKALLSRGCKVCCVDINSEKGKATVEELQKIYGESSCIFAKCDVSSFHEFEEAYSTARHHFGNLNILINNAGIGKGKLIDVNLKGVINGCNIALKYMGKNNGGKGGAVVNVSSAAALQVLWHSAVYSATKAGIVAFTRCYGHEEHYEECRIKFTAVCPTLVNTPLYQQFNNDLHVDKGIKDFLVNNSPMEPSKVAEGIIQLIEEGKNGVAMVVTKEKENEYVNFSEKKYMN